MLKIALPSGKSLEEKTIELFINAFISTERKGSSCHEVLFPDFPLIAKGKFIKPRRIPKLVESGAYDVAITGSDTVFEADAQIEMCARLDYGRNSTGTTHGVLFAHENHFVTSIRDIPSGSFVLSEYPELTKRYFERLFLEGITVVPSTGSVEAEVPDQYRFGVCLTETGRSLRENDLRVIATIFESHTILIANKDSMQNPKKREAIHALMRILVGTLTAKTHVLLTMNVPHETKGKILALLPSITAPTVSPLAGDTPFDSVCSAVKKNEVNQLIPSLLKLGAKGLLIQQMSSLIPEW